MYNPFTEHPRETVGETWGQHCYFAIGVGIRLIFTSLIFIVHGIFPFISIPKWLNLEESIRFLARENKDREVKHMKLQCSHCNRKDGTCGCEFNGCDCDNPLKCDITEK